MCIGESRIRYATVAKIVKLVYDYLYSYNKNNIAPLPSKRWCEIPMKMSCSVVIDALYFRLFMDDVEKDDVDKDEINEDHEVVKLLTH